VFLLYLFTRIRVSKSSKRVFRNSESFTTYAVLSKAKALALVLAKVVVLTLYLLRNNVQQIVKLFLLIN
jgi:hypothetical protein